MSRCRSRANEYQRMIENNGTDSVSQTNFRTIDYMNTLVSNFVKYGLELEIFISNASVERYNNYFVKSISLIVENQLLKEIQSRN